MQLILDHGKLRPPEIMTQLPIFLDAKGTKPPSILHLPVAPSVARALTTQNSYHLCHPYPITSSLLEYAKYTQALYTLVSSSYLKPSTVLSHQSASDKRIKYYSEEKAKVVGYPTTKQLREAKEVAEARLKREVEEVENIGLVSSFYIAR